jgi:hypothetical protein
VSEQVQGHASSARPVGAGGAAGLGPGARPGGGLVAGLQRGARPRARGGRRTTATATAKRLRAGGRWMGVRSVHERGSDEAGGGSTRTHDVHRRWGSVFWRSWGRASSAAACPSLGGRTPTSFTTARRPRTPARGREAGCWRGRGVAARRAGRQAGATRRRARGTRGGRPVSGSPLSAGVPPRLNSERSCSPTRRCKPHEPHRRHHDHQPGSPQGTERPRPRWAGRLCVWTRRVDTTVPANNTSGARCRAELPTALLLCDVRRWQDGR